MTGLEQKTLSFLVVGTLGAERRRAVEDRGWAARLTGCHRGPRCRDVWGVGVCGSKDKHQREYERLDDNLLTGNLRLSNFSKKNAEESNKVSSRERLQNDKECFHKSYKDLQTLQTAVHSLNSQLKDHSGGQSPTEQEVILGYRTALSTQLYKQGRKGEHTHSERNSERHSQLTGHLLTPVYSTRLQKKKLAAGRGDSHESAVIMVSYGGHEGSVSLRWFHTAQCSDLPRPCNGLFRQQQAQNRPRCPSRNIPRVPGPAVNRELKPTKRKNKSKKSPPPAPPEDQTSERFAQSPPPSVQEMIDRLTVHTISDREQTLSPITEFGRGLKVFQELQVTKGILWIWIPRILKKDHHRTWKGCRRDATTSGRRPKEDIDQHDFIPMQKPQIYCEEDWYVGACKRTDAEHALHLVNKDGAFLVRDCSTTSNSEPLVLVVYHQKKVYNVKVRYIESVNKYALGTGQRSNDVFDSVEQIIKFHSIFPIIFISGRNVTGTKYPDNCVLTCPITKQDLDQLLQ
ncbi:Cytokine-dependent hematopoietic cell linker [Oryzias melastigma]|uniref:Cytokine-dependent hematopoietic cell linker n=1 Tax=Oryzias melastigma TaxID=30732 RepID=A0A834CC06_ORYME|nr:Cytokine-dependent hematopoietic cell linker [Oryzias melastigma]